MTRDGFRWVVFLVCLGMFACGRPAPNAAAETEPSAQTEPVAAKATPFLLNPKVLEKAPHAQRDLNELLLYVSERFQIKPEFAFIDETPEAKHLGRMSSLTQWLQFYHLSYYQGETLVWSGSVVLGEGKSVGLTAKRGFQWELTALEGDRTALRFRDGSQEWRHTFQPGTSADIMLGLGEKRVYLVHHYLSQAEITGRTLTAPNP
ncbi:hypothetical protein [Acanthopleuribacter pedis]|uniref:Lipoprotein n=1 Tax=Acanthopleuribacter pedis TaxID=442870 RepID=A0A8J7Q4I2_9BACT|nr:hypothetical protein [Acanthopleuribacter pedis]MBO1318990.1 hypothetical protein [Acanthopleuribacter pedis]